MWSLVALTCHKKEHKIAAFSVSVLCAVTFFISINQSNGETMDGVFKDISAQTFGKYQNCSMAADGMWYADCDFTWRGLKPGALPSPFGQRTLELNQKAERWRKGEFTMSERIAAILYRIRYWLGFGMGEKVQND
jgi:hypothetical protein